MDTRGSCCVPIKKALSRNSTKKVKFEGSGEQDPTYKAALATAAAAEAAAAAAQAAAEVVRITASKRHSEVLREEAAATKIQTAFRGYWVWLVSLLMIFSRQIGSRVLVFPCIRRFQARRTLRCLKGLARMKAHMEGCGVNGQIKTARQRTYLYTRLQSQIRCRRTNNYEKKQILQRRFQLQREKELKATTGGDWNESTQSKAQIETKLLQKQEAAIRRERALAYALIHQQQWRKRNRIINQFFGDPNNPQWGWSWLERWTAAVSGDLITSADKDMNSSQSNKSTPKNSTQLRKSSPFRSHSIDKSSPKSTKHSTTPRQGSPSTSVKGKSVMTPRSWKGSVGDDDGKSVRSMPCKLLTIGGSSTRDDRSQTSTSSMPNYMASTASTRAKSRMPSPTIERSETPSKRSLASPRKKLQFEASPARSGRSSSAPKMRT